MRINFNISEDASVAFIKAHTGMGGMLASREFPTIGEAVDVARAITVLVDGSENGPTTAHVERLFRDAREELRRRVPKTIADAATQQTRLSELGAATVGSHAE